MSPVWGFSASGGARANEMDPGAFKRQRGPDFAAVTADVEILDRDLPLARRFLVHASALGLRALAGRIFISYRAPELPTGARAQAPCDLWGQSIRQGGVIAPPFSLRLRTADGAADIAAAAARRPQSPRPARPPFAVPRPATAVPTRRAESLRPCRKSVNSTLPRADSPSALTLRRMIKSRDRAARSGRPDQRRTNGAAPP